MVAHPHRYSGGDGGRRAADVLVQDRRVCAGDTARDAPRLYLFHADSARLYLAARLHPDKGQRRYGVGGEMAHKVCGEAGA